MYNAVSTYRIQFHKGFTFGDFEKIIPYLSKLGISTIYASPIFKAVPGSMHGYDCIDPLTINPEIGTEEQLRSISSSLKEIDIGWMQDIVPNHMAFHPANTWLMDVLEKGQQSEYAPYFDIDWSERLMVPFLGASLEEVIERNELQVVIEKGKLRLTYYDNLFPLHVIPSYDNADTGEINSNKEKLKALLDAQHYRLCHWQETDKRINYRRFFTINGLICLNMQTKQVFDAYHRKIKQFTDEGIFNGLRIDHVDGLSDPAQYLEDLRNLVGDNIPVVVEKILEPGEQLPEDWAVQGNTGYDFLSLVNNLFTNRKANIHLTRFYKKLAGNTGNIQEQIHAKKADILFNHMAGELDNLLQLFMKLQLVDEATIVQVSAENVKAAIAELLIQCPVYRYYGNCMPLVKAEEVALTEIFTRIRKSRPALKIATHLLEDVLVVKTKAGNNDYNERAATFYKRCMQFAGPLMAKGVEDTLMYTYNRFIGHNEVGDSPETFGISTNDFHRAMIERQLKWPLSLNAMTTHDTKRGEDVRSRLNILTDLYEEWIRAVVKWKELNAGIKNYDWPDVNDEYFIYQVLVGVYPFEGADEVTLDRLQQYIEKSLREAKVYSNWTAPDIAYEKAAKRFITALLNENSLFLKSFIKFQNKVNDYGIINSLSQTILKFTCPGIPDTYQGTELWDFSMVDPDNRRPVDYALRETWLKEIESQSDDENFIVHLWNNRTDGRVKLWLTHQLLNDRKKHPDLFAYGKDIPLTIKGKYKNHIISFARRYKNTWRVIAIPLNIAQAGAKDGSWQELDWSDTHLVLPEDMPDVLTSICSNEEIKGPKVYVRNIFTHLPFAYLKSEQVAARRSAGVLLAISSLPSDYGIGDFGLHARRFAKFLSRSHQKCWQILPLNPIEASAGYSPYSSVSSMAGNTLLISPELIAKARLLDAKQLKQFHLPHKDKTDYAAAEKVKLQLFDIAYENYKTHSFPALQRQFQNFCNQESYWLDDYALYEVLKQQHDGQSWHNWPDEYKKRDAQALQLFTDKNIDSIKKIKWLQLLFHLQWKELKTYCNVLGISIFGDIPFYVSYDSSDVWANPDIFCLDKDMCMAGIAGVPPDYFSEDGQLWGMPTFNWQTLKESNYSWWMNRLKKNLQLFDIVRLDHFRAFAEYWEVPAGETTARNGIWRKGPGREFFNVARSVLGNLPFVAEDLGDNMGPVYKLRDELRLPGMRVLQFAFSERMPESVDIPHNYTTNTVAYTGTHDNNTTVGWYQQETNRADHERLEKYNGTSLREKDVHLVLGRMVYSSVADTVILPMQDILGLGEQARMNTPGSVSNNWTWRLQEAQLTKHVERLLRKWVEIYRR